METKKITPSSVCTTRFVKSEDLNHHRTLFAGRTAEWFVESGFIAAASLLEPQSIVCLKIHGMYFTKPVQPGEIIQFNSKIVYAGKSSLIAHVKVVKLHTNEPFVSGFITFIYVGDSVKAMPHGIEICPQTDEDKELYEQAVNLKN